MWVQGGCSVWKGIESWETTLKSRGRDFQIEEGVLWFVDKGEPLASG